MTEESAPPATEPPDPWEDLERTPLPSGEAAGLRALLASVEELRALLAPLTEEERRRVLELARSLRRRDPPHA